MISPQLLQCCRNCKHSQLRYPCEKKGHGQFTVHCLRVFSDCMAPELPPSLAMTPEFKRRWGHNPTLMAYQWGGLTVESEKLQLVKEFEVPPSCPYRLEHTVSGSDVHEPKTKP